MVTKTKVERFQCFFSTQLKIGPNVAEGMAVDAALSAFKGKASKPGTGRWVSVFGLI